MSVSVASISGISQIPTTPVKSGAPEKPSAPTISTPSTVVSLSKESIENEDAKALADFLASGPGISLKMLSADTQVKNSYTEYQKFTVQPKEQADNSLRRANADLVKLQSRIELNRPSMLGKKWDFVLKDQKIEVVNDNLSAKDRQWLENTLNKNQKLVSAVSNFYDAVTQYYDHTRDHASATMRDGSGQQNGVVFNAAKQINGNLAVRDMMDKSVASLTRPNAYLSSDKEKPFQNSIELSARYLKYETEIKYRPEKFDKTDPVTAQFFKDNPNEIFNS